MHAVARRMKHVALVALGLLTGTGCATVASGGGGPQTVRIASTPPGADVVVDGQAVGQTPVNVVLSRSSDHAVQLTAPGYQPAAVAIVRTLNPWMLGNVVIGGLIGLAVDVVTDSTHRLSPDAIEVQLVPTVPAPQPAASGSPATPPAKSG